MNLPFVLDVAIGLIFIYLILSLLASEIQELITTLLQWRAKHLKDAIFVLLAGGTETEESAKVADLVKELYDDPLLKTVNQEAKSGIAKAVRVITHWLILGNQKGAFGSRQTTGPSYIAPETFATSLLERLQMSTLVEKLTEVRLEKFVTRIIGVYDLETDGSIKIPEDAVLEQLPDDWKKGRVRLIAKKCGKLDLNLDPNFGILIEEYDDILRDYESKQATLLTCVERMGESLKNFNNLYSKPEPAASDSEIPVDPEQSAQIALDADFFRRLESFRLAVFGEKNERAIASGGLKPTLSEIAQLANQTSNTYQEAASAYQKIVTEGQAIKQMVDDDIATQLEEDDAAGGALPVLMRNLTNEQRRLKIDLAMTRLNMTKEQRELYENYETFQSIESVLSKIPNSVKDSLAILADRAQERVQDLGSEVVQFRQEVATWFDRSMARTSGVYKRNAKGVAIILGFLLAFITNSDSFYIVNRLSSDENLRQVITTEAAKITSNTNGANPKPGTSATPLSLKDRLKQVKSNTDPVLRELSLPVGWKPANLTQQFRCTERERPGQATPPIQEDLAEWNTLLEDCLPSRAVPDNPFIPAKIAEIAISYPISLIKMIGGWMVSGLAIAMGAPFWFDLLGKVMNVRNAGSKPKTEATQETAK